MDATSSISVRPHPVNDTPPKSAIENPTTSPSYRMVALDLDGTLLSTNHKLAAVQAEYLRQLHKQGFTVCIATGRAAPSVYETIQTLQIPRPLPVVCSNGARGFMCDYKTMEKTELFYNPVPKDVVLHAIQLVKQHGYALQYYYEDSIYCNPTNPKHYEIMGLYNKLTGSHIEAIQDDFASLLDRDQLPSKMLVLFDDSQCQTAVPIFQTALAESASIVLGSFNWFLEILNPQVNKGNGLANMCQAINIPLNECIAMGDGPNDVEFLEMAGLGIAMKNARASVQKRANVTSEWTNNEHGVMKMLEKLQDQLIFVKDPAVETIET